MKIGCDACGRAEAAVLCCADEAALCRRCDAAVHSANRLAGKHHRVALLPPPLPTACSDDGGGGHPVCDICQEKVGFFFCLDDRALLCRSCDVAIHSASPFVSAHRRFLITGVRIAGDQLDHVQGSEGEGSGTTTAGGVVVSPSSSSGGGNGFSSSNLIVPDSRRPAAAAASRLAVGGDGADRKRQWPWSDIFADGVGMEQCYPGLSEPGSSGLTG